LLLRTQAIASLTLHAPPSLTAPHHHRRRKDNLAARSKTKQDNKKAKREKKLLRAGFEGRKAGFIAPKK